MKKWCEKHDLPISQYGLQNGLCSGCVIEQPELGTTIEDILRVAPPPPPGALNKPPRVSFATCYRAIGVSLFYPTGKYYDGGEYNNIEMERFLVLKCYLPQAVARVGQIDIKLLKFDEAPDHHGTRPYESWGEPKLYFGHQTL